MVDDGTLSREAALMYQYAMGFEPVGGDLTRWTGPVSDSTGKTVQMELKIPDNFPYEPPVLTLPGSTQHPVTDKNGHIITRSISRWRNDSHIFSVIREAKSALASAPFEDAQETQTSDQVITLKNQLGTLKTQLQNKKDEYEKLKNQTTEQVASSENLDDLISDALVDLENKSYALEDAYDNLELKAIDFAKNFIDTRKRYYLVRDSVE